RTRRENQRPSVSCTSSSRSLMVSMTSWSNCSRLGKSRLCRTLLKGRPTSPGSRLNNFPASGVKRRMARPRVSSTIAMLMLVWRLFRSAFVRFISALRVAISSLTVVNSSLVDSSSSFELSSSSLMLCNSSLAEVTSSLDAFRANGLVLLLRLLDGGAQRRHQSFPRHLQHVEAGVAAGRFQKQTGLAPELQDFQLGVNQHPGRGETAERDAICLAFCIDVSGESFRRAGRFGTGNFFLLGRMTGDKMRMGRQARLFGKDFVVFIHWLKQVGK